ncbi:MAG: hypothetical protein IPK39_21735 [Sulfuritalea sp.]|nr:hypothetical protein [Sulfuritalea sp.]
MDLAVVGVAAAVVLERDISPDRIGLAPAAAPVPIRATQAESYLTGKAATAQNISAASPSRQRTHVRALAIVPRPTTAAK